MTLSSASSSAAVVFISLLNTAAIALMSSGAAYGAEDGFVVKEKVPVGFEALSGPQRSSIDIYYGGRYLGSQIVTFTPETIEFRNPGELVAKIEDIKNPALVTESLTGAIDSHVGAICSSVSSVEASQPCDTIQPAIAGAIFDENRFRADLFINPRFLQTKPASVKKYLPPSESGPSFMQNLYVAASGNTASEGVASIHDWNLSGQSLFAWEENSIQANWDYSSNDALSFTNLYAERDFQGTTWQAGMVSNTGFGQSFMNTQSMLGARIATSLNTRTDQRYSSATPLDVFFPTRGRVELRRDNRLLYTGFYEAGNNTVDTSTLPDGAYNLDIRVLDDTGQLIRSETRFFAKQYGMPPPDEWVWFLEAGDIVNQEANTTLPRATHLYMGRGGVGRRLGETWAANLSAAVDNDEQLVELEILKVGNSWSASPFFMLSGSGDKGLGFDFRSQWSGRSLGGNYRRLWSNGIPIPGSGNQANSGNELLNESFEQIAGYIIVPVDNGSVGYKYSYSARKDAQALTIHNLYWRSVLWRGGGQDIDADIGLSKSGSDYVIQLTLNFRYSKGQWDFGLSPSASRNKSEGDSTTYESLSLDARWEDGRKLDGDLIVHGTVAGQNNEKRLNGLVEYSDHRGRGSLAVNHVRTSDDSVTNYALNYGTSLISDGNIVSVGGSEYANSAVVIDIQGRDGDRFDVLVDGRRVTYAVVGEPTVVPLTSYHEYRITVVPAGTSLYEFDEKTEVVTLYPGNVETITVVATPVRLAFGRVLLDKKSGSGWRIEAGDHSAAVSSNGMFQINIPVDTKALRLETPEGLTCSIPLTGKSTRDVLRLGTLRLKASDCVQHQNPEVIHE
ncbi:TcfC E-set like domain-containing protein [Parendozoicomonas haliclonae]|uniref:Pilus assembly protein E-set like domain-containing protein n=1 Tax=Parendozoicomonas haliclonae TaxID=1960125 RepID=A0A1X7AGW3_9GAMM|nr:TcfC E-set like domain-containing protein [Parendozoicomonas haliclonae]SMA39280.1 hypothetical protein EHSB41UT_00999 [Parendozoicomonas haliclonae]